MELRFLSTNRKTGVSLNLPRANCRPTSICRFCCYARKHTMNYAAGRAKWIRNSQYLASSSDCHELITEARWFSAVRIAATGDIIPEHIPNLLLLAKSCPNTQFWGMTRKPELAEQLNGRFPNLKLLVSVDASSPRQTWDYKGKLCFGPRRAQDDVPDDPRIVTVFPYHSSGRIVGNIPEHKLDCPVTRHRVLECYSCQRCWRW